MLISRSTGALRSADELQARAAAGQRYFAQSSYAHGVRYWAAMLAQALEGWQVDDERGPTTAAFPGPFPLTPRLDDPWAPALAMHLPGVGGGRYGRPRAGVDGVDVSERVGLRVMLHNPLFAQDRASRALWEAVVCVCVCVCLCVCVSVCLCVCGRDGDSVNNAS